MRKCVNWLIVASVGILIAFIAFAFNLWIMPMLVDYQVGKTLALNPGTDIYEIFKDTPIPVYLSIYFFNVTNPEEMMAGKTPIVKEVGPYVYKEHRVKKNLEINEKADTVSYEQYINYQFDANSSYPNKEDDLVAPLNIMVHLLGGILGSLHSIDIADELVDLSLPEIMGDLYGPVLKTTVNKIMFSGVELKCNNKSASLSAKIICSAVAHFPGLKILQRTPEGNFLGSIFGFKNRTHSGRFEINRGIKDVSKLGQIVKWQGNETLTIWGGEECNKIAGYDESLLPPFITPQQKIKVFNTDICGSTQLVYSGGISYKDIAGYRFIPDPKFMEDVSKVPENYCFCPQSIQGITVPSGCLEKGVLDISSCMKYTDNESAQYVFNSMTLTESILLQGMNKCPMYFLLRISNLDENGTGIPVAARCEHTRVGG